MCFFIYKYYYNGIGFLILKNMEKLDDNNETDRDIVIFDSFNKYGEDPSLLAK